ncbi:MAG: arginine--tRNA ligase [Fimbriimonadaceae bacterium]|nr:arginine--tRNA ligase [Chitinophagales bacterium]
MKLEELLKSEVIAAINKLYSANIDASIIKIDKTPPEFEGEFTVVTFPFAKVSKKSPDATAIELGNALLQSSNIILKFNVVKGFLNISFKDAYWIDVLINIPVKNYANLNATGKKIVIEYGGPNTNKPLHLGHVRTMLIGYATANILEAAGNEVHKVNILNDRGIAICKSMVAYLRTGNDKTPQLENIKGDHFVGNYYVEYQKIFEQEVGVLAMEGIATEEAEKKAPIYIETVEMLQKWEAHDPEVLALWEKMNNWVYEGFNETYKKLGVDFEKEYKESDYYLKGKESVIDGLNKNVFFKKEDGSVWVDLTSDGLDQKVLLRADGTSVYITQDMGVAEERYKDFAMDKSIYVVANEQDYHFKVLKLVMQKLGEPYADGIFHLSYGMVDLPEGKMKSREGTVVDADDLIDVMITDAKEFLEASEKKIDIPENEKDNLYRQIGLSALKYFILKVDPKKRILFNPKESIDLHGNTGPFIQYTYARIQSIFRKLDETGFQPKDTTFNTLLSDEKELIVLLDHYPDIIKFAAENYSPAEVANYIYHLAKTFNKFYAGHSITKAESEEKLHLRVAIAYRVANVFRHGLGLLGIECPERM